MVDSDAFFFFHFQNRIVLNFFWLMFFFQPKKTDSFIMKKRVSLSVLFNCYGILCNILPFFLVRISCAICYLLLSLCVFCIETFFFFVPFRNSVAAYSSLEHTVRKTVCTVCVCMEKNGSKSKQKNPSG